ncbi:MAG: XdhC family protein [Spirochaetales bacterium]|nr:XdhC family protein [Spirochaetales bacterium]
MDIFKEISEIREQGSSLVVVTITGVSGGSPGKTGFKLLVTEDGRISGTVGGGAIENLAIEEARECLRRGESKARSVDLTTIDMECGGRTDLFFEYLAGARVFTLFGGGHVGRALSQVLHLLGYDVHVYDNRPEALEELSALPGVHGYLVDYQDISPVRDILLRSEYCFIATHGHEFDYTVLHQVLATKKPFRYVGLIGSARKVKVTLQKIGETGLSIPDFVYSPVGLDLGGDSAAEIAVSIAAEVQAVEHGVKAYHMRERLKKV